MSKTMTAPEYRSVAERAAHGRALRAEAPRSAHGEFQPTPTRPDPVHVLEAQSATRVPSLVPIRYGRMLVSPFAFFRGAAAVMAADLAESPRSGLRAQLCGDAHLSNFGVFGSPERRLVFDINDFDETLPGPWEWDVKRLAASFAVAARVNGLTKGQRERVVRAAVESYRTAMRDFASMTNLAVWYARVDVEVVIERYRSALTSRQVKLARRGMAKARTRDSMHALAKLTHEVDGEPRIISDPPLIVPVEDLPVEATKGEEIQLVERFLRGYRSSLEPARRKLLEQYRFVDLAHKVVGVGSVGTQCWIALLLGRDGQDPLFLQVKQAERSVLEQHAGPCEHSIQGERVVAGQHLMQATSDIFLGWKRMTQPAGVRTDFYARQLKDWKLSMAIEAMRPEGLVIYGRLCGWTLARGHARSGDRIAIASYLGGGDVFDRALTSFAEAYADQNERDYAALAEAAKAGRISVVSGV